VTHLRSEDAAAVGPLHDVLSDPDHQVLVPEPGPVLAGT
jgi:hypothetical protein